MLKFIPTGTRSIERCSTDDDIKEVKSDRRSSRKRRRATRGNPLELQTTTRRIAGVPVLCPIKSALALSDSSPKAIVGTNLTTKGLVLEVQMGEEEISRSILTVGGFIFCW